MLQRFRIFCLILLFVPALVWWMPFVVPAALAQTTTPASGTVSNSKFPVYSGVQDSITNYLCTPTGNGTDLIRCINRLYRFGLSFGAVAMVGMIVIAGYVYFFEGEKGKSQAKSIVSSSIIGVVILATSFIILRTINPQLTQFRPIQAPIFSASDLPLCANVGLGVDCITATGQVNNGSTTVLGSAPTGTAQDLAKKLLSSNKVTFLNRRSDGTGAKANIEDIAAGKPAKRSAYGGAPGGSIAIPATTLQGIINLSSKYTFQVSELVGGEHSDNSRHYAGLAVDISPVPKDYRTFMTDCAVYGATEVLGPGDEGHDTHIHCAWPRGSK